MLPAKSKAVPIGSSEPAAVAVEVSRHERWEFNDIVASAWRTTKIVECVGQLGTVHTQGEANPLEVSANPIGSWYN